MIIISQDKDLIINFDNVTVIGIAQSDEKEIDSITVDGEEQFLAEYKTEKRAKEVLQEIINKYRQWNQDANNAVTTIPKVYEMPKE